MLKLEDIVKDASIRGLQGDDVVRVVQVEPVGDNALTVYYKDSQGRLSEQMLFRSDEGRLDLAEAGRPWAFDAPGEDFKLGLEAYRITQAALFDPMMALMIIKNWFPRSLVQITLLMLVPILKLRD